MKKVFITGVVGFIGFNLAISLLKKNFQVSGVDSFDDYYSVKIKKKRFEILKKYKKFKFTKLDITKNSKLEKFFSKNKSDIIIHLAAQAGVRYSLINPNKYLDTNINGFNNVIKLITKFNVKKFIYASSSSIYGDVKKFPINENFPLNPKSIYGISKKINEEVGDYYSKIVKTEIIGLRFFTVYGEWGRPDMFMLKLFEAFFKKKFFYLNNHGNHDRDFTYIGDVTNMINKIIDKKFKQHSIFNICSNRPKNILQILNKFNKNYPVKFKMIEKDNADVLKTHGDNKKILTSISYNEFADFEKKFMDTYNWYKENKIYKL